MTPTPGLASLDALLDDLTAGRLEVLDLTNPLSAHTPVLQLPEPYANLIDFHLEQVSAFDDSGPLRRHNNIHTGEHIGTHLDAPRHWISGRDGDDVAAIPVQRLVGPAMVIDMSDAATRDPDFLLEIDHLEQWQSFHGTLRAGGWLLYRTGWDRYAQDQNRFLNAIDGVSHTPGISAACARWLAEDTPIAGLGVETVGIDAGNAFALDPPMPAHHHLLGNNKYGLTSLQNLDRLPTTGAVVVVSPPPIVGGTGSPTRVLAISPTTGDSPSSTSGEPSTSSAR